MRFSSLETISKARVKIRTMHMYILFAHGHGQQRPRQKKKKKERKKLNELVLQHHQLMFAFACCSALNSTDSQGKKLGQRKKYIQRASQ